MILTEKEKKLLLEEARKSIEWGLNNDIPYEPPKYLMENGLQNLGASFVTLYLKGNLKGCIGTLYAEKPLLADVCRNAYLSAFHDNRFDPLKKDEFMHIQIEISILSEAKPLQNTTEEKILQYLDKKHCGLIIQYNDKKATYLPAVWDKVTDARDFLRSLKRKAGLDSDFWSDDIKLFVYTADKIC